MSRYWPPEAEQKSLGEIAREILALQRSIRRLRFFMALWLLLLILRILVGNG